MDFLVVLLIMVFAVVLADILAEFMADKARRARAQAGFMCSHWRTGH